MNLGNLGRHTIAAPLAALTLVAGGGIALAASGGDGPAPQALEHRTVGKPSPKPTAEPTAEPTDAPDEDDDATPSPSLTGLCKAYQAGGYASSTKNGHVNPAWSALESAAGGAGDVDTFCDETLAADAAEKAARKANEGDDRTNPKPEKPAKDPKPAKVHDGDNDDDADAIDNDDAGDVDDAGDNDDAGDVDDAGDNDDEGDKGSRSSEHGKH